MRSKNIFFIIEKEIGKKDFIEHAIAYGSSFYNNNSKDYDIAIFLKSDKSGIINEEIYDAIKKLRDKLIKSLKVDVDLVPHSMDELNNYNSPIWYPRYNPSLFFGKNIKGNIKIKSSSVVKNNFNFKDMALYVLFDNRTICRRQIVREINKESGRIYVSKLIHGPGNALTYLACKNNMKYVASPSDIINCFKLFDEKFGVNSFNVSNELLSYKDLIDFKMAKKMMSWYERLLAVVLYGKKYSKEYNNFCKNFKLDK